MTKAIEEYIGKIQGTDTVKEFDEIMNELNQVLLSEKYSEDFRREIRNGQKYIKSIFSDEANKEKMLEAKENVLESLYSFLKNEKESGGTQHLLRYLNNFYMFLEALTERNLDKRATLKMDELQKVKIENEYDLQHLLHAVLKPLYPDMRKEVSEDSGVGTVRTDLKIPQLDVAIEAKCTRGSMTYKKLTEEIEADIVHYSEKNIVFFVYDKAKIIKEKQNFETQFNRIFDGKNITMVVLQPISL